MALVLATWVFPEALWGLPPAVSSTTPAASATDDPAAVAVTVRQGKQSPEGVGNIIATMPNGTKEEWTQKGNATKPEVGPGGLCGWTFGDSQYEGALVNSQLKVLRKQTAVATVTSAKPFIEEWKFTRDGRSIIVKSRAAHGPAIIEVFSIESGKRIQESPAFGETLPAWAAPFADEPPDRGVTPSPEGMLPFH